MTVSRAVLRRFERLRWAIYPLLIVSSMLLFFYRMVPAAVMQPAFGWILHRTWDGSSAGGWRRYGWADYRNGLWLSCGFAAVAVFAALRVRETFCRNLTVEVARPVSTGGGGTARAERES